MENRPLIPSTPSSGNSFSDASFHHSKFTSEGVPELHYAHDYGVNSQRPRRSPLLTVIGGQAVLLAIAYGFFAAVLVRGQIPLTTTLADLAQNNPQAKTYIFTFLATGLSAWSSYLFSEAVRHAILICLSRPLPVSTLGFSILISRRSPIFRRRHIKWVIVGAVFFVATLGQTASWTALLTPIQIVIPTPLEGTEIDLTSDAFNNQFEQLWNATSGIENYIDSGIAAFLAASGVAAANVEGGNNPTVDFAGWAYPALTGGILPIRLVDSADPNSNLSTGLLTTNTEPFPGPTSGHSFNKSMSQQGLTALVGCQYQQLDVNTDPPLERVADSVEIAVGGELTTYTAVGIVTSCGAETLRSDVLSSTNNTLLATSCTGSDTTGKRLHTMIIDGQGLYGQTVVCTVEPQITWNVIVNYSDPFVYAYLDDPVFPAMTPTPPSVGNAVLYGVVGAISYSQSATHNTAADSIAAILADQGQQKSPASYLDLWTAYIRGAVEFFGTVMKVNLASPDGPLGGDIPSSMRIRINGTAFTTTYGWEYTAKVNNAILIPSTFVAVASILIVLFAQCLKWNRGISLVHPEFDPNEPLLLMAAASAGGMGETFRGLSTDEIKEGGRKKVMLGQIGDRTGFVQVSTGGIEMF